MDTVFPGVFRRDALDAAGGFDETLLRNEDQELNWRLRERGETVWFDPELAVNYRPRGTLRALARQYFDYGRWKRVVLGRHPGSWRARQLAAPALVAALGVRRRRPEAVLVPVVLATIHVAWGAGFFIGVRARGLPGIAGFQPAPGGRPVTVRDARDPGKTAAPPELHAQSGGRLRGRIHTPGDALRWGVLACIALLPATPFVFTPGTIYPFVAGKAVWSRAIF